MKRVAGGSCRGGRGACGRGLRPRPPSPHATRPIDVIWHDVECEAYAADLGLWEELADDAEGPILDLGCGTGRVSLHLAARGHRVLGVDLDAGLIAAFTERARGLPTEAEVGDARDFALAGKFGLVLAPMQLVQLLASSEERVRCLRCAGRHLVDGGLAAFAIVESMPEAVDAPPPPPDAREVDGWVYSSLPIDAQSDTGAIRVRRLRQAISPEGGLDEEVHEIRLQALDAATLEREGREAGLRPASRREVPATEAHVGSTVVLLEKRA